MGDYWKETGSQAIDEGWYQDTQDPADRYVFKVLSLRNVSMTSPYFHDGSVAGLPEAVRIMARLQLGKSLGEKGVSNIVAFLLSLTGDLPANFQCALALAPPAFPAVPGGSALTQQFRARQKVEKRQRIAVDGMALNTSLLMGTRAAYKIHIGWHLG